MEISGAEAAVGSEITPAKLGDTSGDIFHPPPTAATKETEGGKKKVKKKKKVSKHVIAAREKESQDVQADEEEGKQEGTPSTSAAPSKKKLKKKQLRRAQRHIKDPKEAAAYLSSWKHRDSGEGVWKFNKNTQSWLIRNMYDKDKLAKAPFADLLEYLQGLNKGITRMRMRDDAERRAMRYKQWEKSGNDSNIRVEDEDHEEWAALDDGGKRKEYKRARQVLDMLREHDNQ
mmetsp:Transcript_33631/g.100315  ORF Transcript_33631/g.100315 Transcript_33631/m.100315 type:complete len:231 (-) Transcript_33631:2757-3449(-)